MTIAARSCPTYQDITANRARNNIMESLKDLGPDTPYGQNGLPLLVDPAVEAQVQPNCTAIDNWEFTLGTGIATRDAVPPEPWGRLSYVTDPFSPVITTQPSVPLLNGLGQPTGSTIYGATTITLTTSSGTSRPRPASCGSRAARKQNPITDAETYGFGALRCATDNLNGDNVEWISYPPDTTHVFCFAYYVKPPPTSGTITVRKEVSLPPDTPAQKLRFTGNISYANNEFFLTAVERQPDEPEVHPRRRMRPGTSPRRSRPRDADRHRLHVEARQRDRPQHRRPGAPRWRWSRATTWSARTRTRSGDRRPA